MGKIRYFKEDNRIGSAPGEWVANHDRFWEGWDLFAKWHTVSPHAAFMVARFNSSTCDFDMGIRFHAQVMMEEYIGKAEEAFFDTMLLQSYGVVRDPSPPSPPYLPSHAPSTSTEPSVDPFGGRVNPFSPEAQGLRREE